MLLMISYAVTTLPVQGALAVIEARMLQFQLCISGPFSLPYAIVPVFIVASSALPTKAGHQEIERSVLPIQMFLTMAGHAAEDGSTRAAEARPRSSFDVFPSLASGRVAKQPLTSRRVGKGTCGYLRRQLSDLELSSR